MSSWNQVNQNLIAKSIGEMIFEENICVFKHADHYSFTNTKNQTYTFKGQESLWGWIKVDPLSIERNHQNEISAAQFFIDTQEYTKMSDVTLAQFLEEMRSTLFADLHLNHEVSAKDYIKLNFLDSQQLLNGHPKILLNKGRLGWSIDDWKKYAPENAPAFPLQLIAIKSTLLKGILPSREHYLSLMSEADLENITKKININEFSIIPVHPWQWNNVITYHYQNEIQKQEIIDLGTSNFHFSAQTSLRTLNCIDQLEHFEIKLPLSILNTSCIRGIPAKTIEMGVKISTGLTQLIASDPYLNNKVEILTEKAGVNYVAKDLAQISHAPYRFHEFLGVIWRESAFSKIKSGQKIILTANLLYQDKDLKTSTNAFIQASKLTPLKWIKKYTEVVILGLYHLQAQHGIGLVSHGQNIMLILENDIPHKLVIKDFQGDLRFSSKAPENTLAIFSSVIKEVTKLPPEHLIHDLYTAHFVTLIRFVIMNLVQETGIPESDFYQVISSVIKEYENEFHPQILLTKPSFEKILVNSVRFKIGYGDSTERPLPLLGTTIKNPLHQVNI